MDYLIKQSSRVRFSGKQTADRSGSRRERRLPPQQTPSFKEEKKIAQNWFRRKISWQMNPDYDLNEIEQAVAVAAAAYAITSMTDKNIPEKKNLGHGHEPSLNRSKSRKEDTTVSIPEPDQGSLTRIKSRKEYATISSPSKEFSGKDSMRNSEIEEEDVMETSASHEKTPAKVVGPSPSVKRTPTHTDKPVPKAKKVPTFSDEQLNARDGKQPESLKLKTDMPVKQPEITTPKSDLSTPYKPPISSAQIDRQASTKLGKVLGGTEVEADAWERAKLDKLKKRYETVDARILSWENKKKSKSRRRLDKTESELERKRLKALEQFRSEIEDINQIAEGARTKARERRKQEELKAKEKANTFRKTGKLPRTCFCF